MKAICEMPEVEKLIQGLAEICAVGQNRLAADSILHERDVWVPRINREVSFVSEGENVD